MPLGLTQLAPNRTVNKAWISILYYAPARSQTLAPKAIRKAFDESGASICVLLRKEQ